MSDHAPHRPGLGVDRLPLSRKALRGHGLQPSGVVAGAIAIDFRAEWELYECMHTRSQALDAIALVSTGVPIYVQLREQFLSAIGRGLLKPGDQMPTMRQVAVHFRVDLNTVRHAYEELERLGALVLVRGRGSFVAEPTEPAHPAQRQDLTETLARQTLAAARAQGINPAALCDRIVALAAAKED